MATMVGKEKDLVNLLKNLVELDFDAIEAYEAAIDRVQSESDKASLARFMEDHRRHVADLSRLIEAMGDKAPQHGDIKRVLTKGKVVIGGLLGDHAVLLAMKTNEDDTNTAYERAAVRMDIPTHIREVLDRNLSDERRHRAWFESRLARPEATAHR